MNPQKYNETTFSTTRRSENASWSSSYYENSDLGSVWLAEFLSYEKTRKETTAKKDLLNFTELPGSTVHPHVAKHLVQRVSKTKSSNIGSSSRVSGMDTRRLKELSKNARNESQSKKGQKQPLAPYVEANAKISRVLQHVKLKRSKEGMQARQLNDFYKLVARETRATIKIQSQCRRLLAKQYAQLLALKVLSATQIQSCARMFLASKCLKALKAEKRRVALVRERCICIYIARIRRRKRAHEYYNAAVRCQSAVRMFIAKRFVKEKRRRHSQRLNLHRWKYLSLRLAWKDLRMNYYARQIQCISRRKLARNRVTSLFTLYTIAAVQIQCAWRRFSAKTIKDDIIYKAMEDKRFHKLRLIASEREYWKRRLENLTKSIKIQQLNDLHVQKKHLEQECVHKGEEIIALESHYKEQIKLKRQLSPGAKAGGWEEQIETNLKDTRERITEAKLYQLFHLQIRQTRVESEMKLMIRAREDAKQSLDHWSNWHQSEQDRLWEFQRHHNREVEKKEFRHSVVNEIMRWTVKRWTPSGKPDKRKVVFKGTLPSGERVQQLISAVKEKAEEYQAFQHVEHTFRPFQNIRDNLDLALSDQESKVKPTQTKYARFASAEDNAHKLRVDTLDELECASMYPKRMAFPAKLPWNLLEKVRDERNEIAVSLQPK